MRKSHQPIEAESATAALDRMERPENRIYGIVVRSALRDLGEMRIGHVDQLDAFVKIGCLEVVEAGHSACSAHPQTRWTSSTNFSGLNGLTSQPVAPAPRPSAFFVGSDSVVSIRIGTDRCLGSARNALISPTPSSFGMLKSVMT